MGLPDQQRRFPLAVSDLWRWDGSIDRGPYIFYGVTLSGIKYGIDSFVSWTFFHKPWSFLNYIMPGQSLDLLALQPQEITYLLAMISLALPFIWTGTTLTLRRLRGAGLPPWLVKLFFVPVVNFIMFLTLCVMPTQEEPGIKLISEDDRSALAKVEQEEIDGKKQQGVAASAAQKPLPVVYSKEDRSRSALFAICSTVPIASLALWFGTIYLQGYGWWLFIALPFAMGMAPAYLYGKEYPRPFKECALVSMAAVTLFGVAIFFYAWEGAICLLMAAPIGYAIAMIGCWLGWSIQRRPLPAREQKLIMSLILLVVPVLMGAEYAEKPEPPLCAVTTTITVPAPPDKVWPNIIAFPELKPPDEPIFYSGIAYPVGATINGRGAGAVRKCRFSTGAFIEPITVWQEPNLLKFSVIAQPPPMREFSWRHEIQPAHLHGYLKIHGGQFQLTPVVQPDGSVFTEIRGTTWYQNQMFPASYWRFWTDYIMHEIHSRVLRHIKSVTVTEGSS